MRQAGGFNAAARKVEAGEALELGQRLQVAVRQACGRLACFEKLFRALVARAGERSGNQL